MGEPARDKKSTENASEGKILLREQEPRGGEGSTTGTEKDK